MAAPLVPIEIWAYGDIVLPNTHELNKARPIDDLWNKGWDEGEKPACEEFNYVLNMLTSWAKYITGEQIPDLDSRFLRISQNLADLSDKNAARSNLDVWSKTEANQRYVDVTGDTMTGPLTLNRINFVAAATDTAYITTTTPADDVTYLDFVVGDNSEDVDPSVNDAMRFRFQNVNGNLFSIMELTALTTTAGQVRINGNISSTGSVQASSVTAPAGTFANLSVPNTITVGTVQSTTTRATNIVATNNITTNTLNVTGTGVLANLVVQNNSATVGGRNVVRSVNGSNADVNGNVTITLPPQGVMDIRLGAQVQQYNGGPVPAGHCVTWVDGGDVMEFTYAKPIQKLINGVWYTIAG